ncbi:MAG: hypothetical protein SOS93_06730 [Mannheimia varigena]|nr:hypothetical protein [Mannheimia varigena]
MRNLRKLAILAIGLGTSVNAFADWITIYSIDGISSGNLGASFRTCRYSTSPFGGGETISIRVSGSFCPSSIEYNPETNTWRE